MREAESSAKALQWHKESRTKVLHKLHSSKSEVTSHSKTSGLNFRCYEAPLFRFDPLSFSERYILLNCFQR